MIDQGKKFFVDFIPKNEEEEIIYFQTDDEGQILDVNKLACTILDLNI